MPPSAPVQVKKAVEATVQFDTMIVKTNTGNERRQVTRVLNASSGIPSLAGKTLYHGGTLDDGVRSFEANGTGKYTDGQNIGDLEWGYAISNGRPIVKTFREWGEAFHLENDQPAARVYINFISGPKSGESYSEVVGCPSPSSKGIFLSPIFATKE